MRNRLCHAEADSPPTVQTSLIDFGRANNLCGNWIKIRNLSRITIKVIRDSRRPLIAFHNLFVDHWSGENERTKLTCGGADGTASASVSKHLICRIAGLLVQRRVVYSLTYISCSWHGFQ